jgi:hypothetical protein
MGRSDIKVVEAAARRIERRAPSWQSPDLLAVLRMLSEGRYTASELGRIVPDEVVMSSSLFARLSRRVRAESLAKGLAKGLAEGRTRGLAEGRAEGRAQGAIATARALCLGLVEQHHSSVLPVLAPLLDACSDVDILQRWALATSRLSDAELVSLVRSEASGGDRPRGARDVARRRAPRPARRARRSKRG